MKVTKYLLGAFATLLLATGLPISPHLLTEISVKPLESFVRMLRSFIFETSFVAPAFEMKQKELATSVAGIREIVAKCTLLPGDELSRQIQFAESKYYHMKASSEYWKSNKVGYPSKDLIYSIDDLLISLLVVQDSLGEPDPFVPHYSKLVSQFRKRLDKFEERSRALPLEPQLTLQIARGKLELAERSIEELEGYSPPDDLHKSRLDLKF